MDSIFGERATVTTIMRIEAALATSQAKLGIIPESAAQTICAKAHAYFAPAAAIEKERARVGHPLVALLNTWSIALGDDAASYLHYGATTPDIRLTLQITQMRAVATQFIDQMKSIESDLMRLSQVHRATPMMGRTVGRHALPITFGLKTASWMAENRRNIERLKGWLLRTRTGVLAGAVGTYAGLGPQGFTVEDLTMETLGFGPPDAVDWKGTRDKHAEWGCMMAIAAKSMARMAQDIFLLQGDDFGELDEGNKEVGSSTMPHKSNPRKATAVIALSRTVTHEVGVIFDWMVSIYERDQISNDTILCSISTHMNDLLSAAKGLVESLVVRPKNMAQNLERTGGLIMAERVMFHLGQHTGKHKAHSLVREAALRARDTQIPFRQALLEHNSISPYITPAELDELLNPQTYLGLAPQAVDRALSFIAAARSADDIKEKSA